MLRGYDWTMLGLMLDVCGSLVLASGPVFKPLRDARYESLTLTGGNSAIVRSAMLQQGDSLAGGVLLASGFFLQLWGAFHSAAGSAGFGTLSTMGRAAAALGVIAVLSAAVWRTTRAFARRAYWRYGFRGWTPNQPPYALRPTEPGYPDRQAWSLNETRRRNESDEALLARLTIVRDDLGRKYGPR